jgi:protein-L-isoaspartate O-methyltransferase
VATSLLRSIGKIYTSFIIASTPCHHPCCYLPPSRFEAYFDRPFKRDFVHISAPHMYVTVLDALELKPGQAFLNVGSGSGYLTCLAASQLGEGGVSHGIDINLEVVSHSQECCKRWYSNLLKKRSAGDMDLPPISPEGVQIVVGNCFDLHVKFAEQHCKYDRIYIGAGCPEKRIDFFYDLLAEDGILVVPIDDSNELVKIRRVKGSVFTKSHITQVHFAPLLDTQDNRVPGPSVLLPRLLWTPSASRHKQFPPAFRAAVHTIVFGRPNFAVSTTAGARYCRPLPIHLWMDIFTYCTRDWFVPCRNALQCALEELAMERNLRVAAEEKLRRIESLQVATARERDLYRVSPSTYLCSSISLLHPERIYELIVQCFGV